MREVSALQLSIQTLAEEFVSLAHEKNITFGTAESCTGGLISSAVTDVAGASAIFMGSIVAYDPRVKTNILGVREDTIANVGAVSYEVASEMARSTCKLLGVDLAVSITGIAGPDGGTPEKPVGLIYIGIAEKKGFFTVTANQFDGDRTQIRLQAAEKALTLLIKSIQRFPKN